MLSLSPDDLTIVTGGLAQQAAMKILQRHFPQAKVLISDIAADGRPFQTLRGGWRFAVETAKDAWMYVVSKRGRVMKDPMGQGDL
jgi:hypothetical protein